MIVSVCILDFVTQHANRAFCTLYYIVICGLPDYHIFSHYFLTAGFSGKKEEKHYWV